MMRNAPYFSSDQKSSIGALFAPLKELAAIKQRQTSTSAWDGWARKVIMKPLGWILIMALLGCSAPIIQGCASEQQTKTVEQTTTTPGDNQAYQYDQPNRPTTTTTTRTETTNQHPESVLGAT